MMIILRRRTFSMNKYIKSKRALMIQWELQLLKSTLFFYSRIYTKNQNYLRNLNTNVGRHCHHTNGLYRECSTNNFSLSSTQNGPDLSDRRYENSLGTQDFKMVEFSYIYFFFPIVFIGLIQLFNISPQISSIHALFIVGIKDLVAMHLFIYGLRK